MDWHITAIYECFSIHNSDIFVCYSLPCLGSRRALRLFGACRILIPQQMRAWATGGARPPAIESMTNTRAS